MKKDLISLLRESGLKSTKIRVAILGLFSEGCKPINAEYVFMKLKGSRVNIVTIYRTLASFEKAGILKRVGISDESAHYELAGHHHHHIVCADCGTVESFERCNIDQLSKGLLGKSSKFSVISQHSLEFMGICKSCVRS